MLSYQGKYESDTPPSRWHRYLCLHYFSSHQGIGIGVDFYSEKFIWEYIVAFLILRMLALVFSLIVILISNWRKKEPLHDLGDVILIWMCLTWISTVILGIPVASAIWGASKGTYYGLLASISNFIFPLPLQIVLMETHAIEMEHMDDGSHSKDATADWITNAQESCQLEAMEAAPNLLKSGRESRDKWWVLTGGKYMRRRDLWTEVLRRFLRNPFMQGIFVGFVLSISKLGPKYLNPNSPDFVNGLGWIDMTLFWLGSCTSPVSLFTLGIWMQEQGVHQLLFSVKLGKLALYLLSKLVLVPLAMAGIAKLMGFENEPGRAAVLIASLPISSTSFSLGHQYMLGEAELSANVAAGTLLMLPTVLVWNVVMDSLNLFPS